MQGSWILHWNSQTWSLWDHLLDENKKHLHESASNLKMKTVFFFLDFFHFFHAIFHHFLNLLSWKSAPLACINMDMSTRCCLQSFWLLSITGITPQGCHSRWNTRFLRTNLRRKPTPGVLWDDLAFSRIQVQEYIFKLYSNIPVFKNLQDFWSSPFSIIQNLPCLFDQWRHGIAQQLLMDVCCSLPIGLTAHASQLPTPKSASQL